MAPSWYIKRHFKIREFRKSRVFYSSKVGGFKLNLHYKYREFVSLYNHKEKTYA